MKLVKSFIDVYNVIRVGTAVQRLVDNSPISYLWTEIQEPEEKRRWVDVEIMGGLRE